MEYIYRISGMKCGSCVSKIKEALRGFAQSVEVTLDPPQLKLDGSFDGNLEPLNAVLKKIGDYKIVPLNGAPTAVANGQPNSLKIYYPLFLILGMVLAVSFAGAESFHDWMLHFMAGFFLVFGAFKLFDLKGFKEAYATYDLLAKYWPGYGYIYPFLELGVGFAFLYGVWVQQALWFSLFLMGFSSLGVAKILLKKQKIRCACLGTVLNLPMTSISLFEDLGMFVMAIWMLI